MANVAIPFQDLAARIQQQEAELAKLRQELETRQSHLSELKRRKEDLQAELQKIDKEIEAVDQNGAVSAPAAPAKPVPPKDSGKRVKGVSLPSYLVSLVKNAKRPITAKELAEEVVRNKYPTTARDVEGMVKTRVYDLVKKGILRRPDDSPGVVLAAAAAKSGATKAPTAAHKNGKKTSAKPTTPAQPAKWQSLHEVLTHVLAKSSRPLSAQELTDQVIEAGYESKSKDLKNVIWVSIKKLAGVERIPGVGYRLKKAKASGAGKKS